MKKAMTLFLAVVAPPPPKAFGLAWVRWTLWLGGPVMAALGAGLWLGLPQVVVRWGSVAATLVFFCGAIAEEQYKRRKPQAALNEQLRRDGPAPLDVLVVHAPGARLLELLPYLFSRKTIEQTFTPAMLDMRIEYFDALATRQRWLARAIYVRWVVGLAETVLLSWAVSFVKKVRAFWKIVG